MVSLPAVESSLTRMLVGGSSGRWLSALNAGVVGSRNPLKDAHHRREDRNRQVRLPHHTVTENTLEQAMSEKETAERTFLDSMVAARISSDCGDGGTEYERDRSSEIMSELLDAIGFHATASAWRHVNREKNAKI